jgi:hypothetical protein
MKYLLFLAPVCSFFIINSCKKYKPAPEAFFMESSPVLVAPTSTAQGSGSHKITDLYLYVNGKFQGAYQNGNAMPVVTRNQNVTIDIFAGIKNNGISATSIPWIFYEKIRFDTLVESGKTVNRPLTFKYNPNVKFAWVEDFDNPIGYSLIKTNYPIKSDTMFKAAVEADNFEGRSIEIGLTSGLIAQFESSVFHYLPKGNANVFLELNYKGNQEFEIGVTDDGVSLKSALTINPKKEWNKIYVQLADAVNRPPHTSDKYKIYFRMLSNSSGDARIWLDNIKLIYL